MIPFDHWHDNGDGTAWLAVECPPDSAPASWEQDDKPCDRCYGVGTILVVNQGEEPCPARCIDGRHTFDIEVGTPLELSNRRPPYLTTAHRITRHRVSIVPGMVLPIVDAFDVHYPSRCIIMFDPPLGGLVNSRRDGWGNYPEDNLTLPPAAAPGMWAVKVRLAPENVESPIDNLARLYAAGCDIVQTADDPEFCWTHNRTGGDCLAELDAPKNVEP